MVDDLAWPVACLLTAFFFTAFLELTGGVAGGGVRDC